MRDTSSLTLRSSPWISLGGILLSAITAAAVLLLENPLPLALLPAAILLLWAFPRLLSNPIPVLAGFLLLVVNLHFLSIGESVFNADVVISALLAWTLLIRFGLRGKGIASTDIEKVLLFYLVATFVSVLLSVSLGQSIKRWGRDVQYLILVAFLFHYAMTSSQRLLLIKAVIFSSIIPCVTGYVGMWMNIPSLLGSAAPLAGEKLAVRISGTTSHPVTLSLYLAVVATLTLSLVLHGRLIRRRYTVPLLAFQLVSLYFTYGRSGWGTFIVGAVALLWLSGRRKMLLTAVPFVAVFLWNVVPGFWERWNPALGVEDNSLLWRVGLWIYAMKLFPARPVFGSGPGTFIDYVAYQKGYAAHQTWVGRLIETGVLGTLAFLVLLLVLGRVLKKRHRAVGPGRDPILEAALASWLGLAIATFVTDGFANPSVIVYFWALVGLSLQPVYMPSHSTRSSSAS